MPGFRWTAEELRTLRDQIAQGAPRNNVSLPSRTPHAIRSQLLRRKLVPRRRILRRWSETEILRLTSLAQQRLSAAAMHAAGFFPDRSVDSIAQQMRRLRLGDPVRSRRQRRATRLRGMQLAQFHAYLKTHARITPTRVIAKKFGVSRGTVKRHLAQRGIRVTWHDAMAMPSSKLRQRRIAHQRNLKRWARWRVIEARRLPVLFEKLKGMNAALEMRVCQSCARTWYATDDFFKPRPKRRDRSVIRVYLSRSCRICLAGARSARRPAATQASIGP